MNGKNYVARPVQGVLVRIFNVPGILVLLSGWIRVQYVHIYHSDCKI
jgi:hypothetical protein